MARIPGIGTLSAHSLTLTHEATRVCGHLLPQGVSAGERGRAMSHRVIEVAEAHATATGRPVEVYATKRGAQAWVVDVVEPPAQS